MTTTTALPNHPPDISPPDNDHLFDPLHAVLRSPNDYSFQAILDSFYHHFNIADYLDQIGILDDRLTDIGLKIRALADSPLITPIHREALLDLYDNLVGDSEDEE